MDTYEKPQARTGRAGVEMFDNSYEFKDVRIDGVPVSDISVMSGDGRSRRLVCWCRRPTGGTRYCSATYELRL